MKIVATEKWIPCDGIILEHNADAAVRTNRNVLVVAGPGAGKTELLVFTPPQNVSKLTVLPVQLLMDIMSISS